MLRNRVVQSDRIWKTFRLTNVSVNSKISSMEIFGNIFPQLSCPHPEEIESSFHAPLGIFIFSIIQIRKILSACGKCLCVLGIFLLCSAGVHGEETRVSRNVSFPEKKNNASDKEAIALYLRANMLKEQKSRKPEETQEMISCLEEAGKRDFADAWFVLGCLYTEGFDFIDPDHESAKKYFLKAEMLEPRAAVEYNLGFLCETMPRGERDFSMAEYWYKLASAKGNRKAEAHLGILFYNQRDFSAARRHLERSAPAGYAEVISSLHALNLYEAVKSGKESSIRKARKKFAELHQASINGDSSADLALGKYFLLDESADARQTGWGLHFLRRAARCGETNALRMIGQESARMTDEWKKLSGRNFAKALISRASAWELPDDSDTELFREIRRILEGTGVVMLDNSIFCFRKDFRSPCEFFAVGCRQISEGSEFYLLQSSDGDFQIFPIENTARILHVWTDAGYLMVACRTQEGTIQTSGYPIGIYQGSYPGNDGREETPYWKYERGDFKKTHIPAIESFLPTLKHLLQENRRTEIAAMVKYPLFLEEDTLLSETIRDEKAFLRNFECIFSPVLVRDIMKTPDDELFSSWMGVGIGSGLLWIGPGMDKEEKSVRIRQFGSRLLSISHFPGNGNTEK